MKKKYILSLHTRHDANLSISDGKKIILYLEFEKIAKKRYFAFERNPKNFFDQFKKYVWPYIQKYPIKEILLCWVEKKQEEVLRKIFPSVKIWKNFNHHISHVWSAYMFTNPQESDLIISYDGGGNLDDYFKIYSFREGQINFLLDSRINLGKPYRLLALLSPELYNDRKMGYQLDRPLSGKKMALAALGKVKKEYLKPLEKFYRDFHLYSLEKNFKVLLKNIGFKNKKFLPQIEARDLMASSQYFFEETFKRYVYPFLEEGIYKRLIVVGGCALNVTINTKISEKYDIPMFIPPCPSDCGISLGLQKINNPNMVMLKNSFSNIDICNKLIFKEKSKKLNKIDLDKLADFIAEGKVIGILRNQLEIGPRALGNRSYLANPLKKGMKNKINKIKGREWWRPVAPIITKEKLNIYFKTKQESPYMSFAPKVRKKYEKLLGEIIHFDSSARIQTVSSKDGWIYDLIKKVGQKTGMEIVMNTSFNKKGEPLINDYYDAFEILKNTDLDGIYSNSYYFTNPKNNSKNEKK